MIRLLAPAKNREVALAAIDAGADAIYIGAPRFGARAAAGNTLEDIRAVCAHAHMYDVEVDVTVNTLLHDDEIQEAVNLIWQLYEASVDAVLIQDLRLLAEKLPPIRLHASTQCDNRTLERVQQLEQLGFQRVVLARELSLKEIADIRKDTQVELESFIHGALCVSYSGRCYLSERVCGRSANRGECAQMCRLQYDVLDENKQEMLHQKHVLSLMDLQRTEEDIRRMIEAGVSVFKIEGRLKDVDYVRNVVAYYHQVLTRLGVERGSRGRVEIQFAPNPEKTFHRGATSYFLYERPRHLVNMETPKSTGEFIGTSGLAKGERNTTIYHLQPGVELHNGDGICFGNEGFYWPNNKVRIPSGTKLYRNYDAEFHKQLMAKEATRRLLPIRIELIDTEIGFRLTAQPMDDERMASIEVVSEKVDASNPDRAESVVRQQLSKLGGTAFVADEIYIQWERPRFLQAAVVNEWRRQLVEALEKMLSTQYTLSIHSVETIEKGTTHIVTTSKDSLVHEDGKYPLMTCRYCLLYELGQCKKSAYRGPRASYLRQGNLLLRITTDCAKCEMKLDKV